MNEQLAALMAQAGLEVPSDDVIRHWLAWGPSVECPDELIDHDADRIEQFEAWFAEVKEAERSAERERIITLLEAERGQMSHGNDYYSDPLSYAIALIKGENK